MPHINAFIPQQLSPAEEQKLVSAFGKLIPLIPSKTEASLMVSVHHGMPLYHGGESREKAAYIEVKIFKECPRESKNDFAQATIKMLNGEWNIPQEHIYINFFEVFNWAAGGKLLNV